MDKYKVELVFTEPLLGTVPEDPDVYKNYIEPPAEVEEEELSTLPEPIETATITSFHHDADGPFIYNYMIRGYLKEVCGSLRRDPDSLSSKIRAYKKIINGLVFVRPRRIRLNRPVEDEMEILSRPLRAETARGPRVALSHSRMAEVGTTIKFEVSVIAKVTEKLLRELFGYGENQGLGQWRTGGFGTFQSKIVKLDK